MRIKGAHILTRFSTDNQNESSTEDQIAICKGWCERNNVPILGIYSDEAISGMKETRPRYQAMMEQLRNGIGDTVVIYDQSRMFRKMTAWFAFRDELERMGVSVISATQPMIGKDLREPQNFMVEGSMALFNQMWVLQTRQRVMVTMRRMAREGKHTGGKPPLGYAVDNGELVVCEHEAAVVRRIFAEYASGHSYSEIIGRLNSDGIRTRRGNAFGSNSLHDLLKNEKYIGTLIYGKSPKRADGSRNTHAPAAADAIRLENAVPSIIDRETWEKVQRKMKLNKRATSGRPSTVREYPLKGKVFCGECGAALNSMTSNGKYHYYECTGKKRQKNCQLMPMKTEFLEQYVAAAVRQVLGDSGNIERLIAILRNERLALQNGAIESLRRLSNRLTEIDRQLEQAVDAILQGLNSQVLTNRINQLEHEKAITEADLKSLKNAVDASELPETTLRGLFESAIATDDASTLLHLVSRVEVYHDTIKIWTILDNNDNDPTNRSKYDDTNMISVEGIAETAPCPAFIKTVGNGLPAPNNRIP